MAIPIVVGMFTNSVSADTIKRNPIKTLLAGSVILNVILSAEFYIYFRNSNRKKRTFESDKAIIQKLVSILNLSNNEQLLKSENHASGLDYSYVEELKDFIKQSNKLENQINDESLKLKVDNFRQGLDTYMEYVSRNMTTNAKDSFKTISIPYELKHFNYDLYEKRLEQLNESADNAYEKLRELITTLRERNIL